MPVTPVHRADISYVPIASKNERSAFPHEYQEQRKMSACVRVGVRQMLEYITVGVAYGRYLCSHLCCRPMLLPSDTAAIRLRPLLSSLRPLLPDSNHGSLVHCAFTAAVCTVPPLSAAVLQATPPPLPPTATTFHPPLRRTR